MVLIFVLFFSYLNKNVINDGLNSVFNAIYDLLNLGKSITLKFGFCNIYFNDRTLNYTFAPSISENMNNNKVTHQSKV